MSDLWDYGDDTDEEIEQPITVQNLNNEVLVSPPAAPVIQNEAVIDLLDDDDDDMQILDLPPARNDAGTSTIGISQPSAVIGQSLLPRTAAPQFDAETEGLLANIRGKLDAFKPTTSTLDNEDVLLSGRPAISSATASILHRRIPGAGFSPVLEMGTSSLPINMPTALNYEDHLASVPSTSGAVDQIVQENRIEIIFRVPQGPSRIRVEPSAPLSRAFVKFRTHAISQGWVSEGQKLKFTFDGDVVGDDETAESLELEEKDIIDVHIGK